MAPSAVISNEQAVIAAVLLDQRVLRAATAECMPADFEDLRLGDIFRGMTAMYATGQPIDGITVSSHLAEWGIRGIDSADLFSWTSQALPVSVAGYARAVRQGAVRRGLREVASRIVQETATSDPGVVAANAAERLRKLSRETAQEERLRLKTLGEVLENGDDDYDWTVPDLLERGDRLLLTGVEGGGKSTLVRQIAIMASAGLHPFTFFPQKPVRVLVVDAENTEKQWRRASRRLVYNASLHGSQNPADVMHILCSPKIDLTKDVDLADVHSYIDEAKPDVLFIGPLYRLIPRAINSDDDASPLLAALDTLRARGTSMVIEAHAGHATGAGGERDLRPRGSAALLGWPEFGLGLLPDKGARSSNEFKLVRWRGDRDQRKWPSRIARGVSDWPWTPSMVER